MKYQTDQNGVQEPFKIPVFSNMKREENVFKLSKANHSEVRMTSFLLSCMKTIQLTFELLGPNFIEEGLDGKK